MHYYKFNIGDYASHTRHLSLMEDLAYRRLLDVAYTSEKPLPKDAHALARLIGMRDQQSEIEDVLKEFFEEVEEGWIHGRVLKEIEEAGGRSDKAKIAAKARWECKRNADAMQPHCLSDAPSINNNAPSIKNDATQDPLHTTHNPLPTTQNQLPKTEKSKSIASATADTKKNARTMLAELGVEEQSAKDWLDVRKAKRAPLTKTALDELIREAGKAGITVNEAVTICAKRSWQGFNASWDWKGVGRSHQTPDERRMASTDKAIEEWLGESNTIEGECHDRS